MQQALGFVGLGQMGAPMAANIVTNHALGVYDRAGTTALAPAGTSCHDTLADIAKAADTVFLSVPDGQASLAILQELATMTDRRVQTVIDLSTTGIKASRETFEVGKAAGMLYVDAPVSGGQAGARAGTVSLMWAGPKMEMEKQSEVLQSFTGNVFHVGGEAGQGQALKVANNFLSGTALVATSEAILFGLSQGLDMEVMLDLINVSTGRNTATSDKFPKRVLTESFDAGFRTALEAKDLKLYMEALTEAGTPGRVSSLVCDIWNECDKALPDSDFTRVYEYIRDRRPD